MKLKTKNTETGYQSIATGQPVVFLHGWGCD